MSESENTFRLENEAPRHRPWRGADRGEETQAVLFTGLDELPGQLDLFCTDYDGDRDAEE